MNPHFGVSTLCFLAGLLHRQPRIARIDAALFQWLHGRIWRAYPLFRLLWPLGTTPTTLLFLFALWLFRWQLGLTASLAYALAAGLERSIKLLLRRQRPFQVLPATHMTQPRQPADPSFPSGDALRLWFMAGVLFFWLGSTPLALVALALAALTSLGRIGLGVHYPLDVVAGSGLGWFFAALTFFFLR